MQRFARSFTQNFNNRSYCTNSTTITPPPPSTSLFMKWKYMYFGGVCMSTGFGSVYGYIYNGRKMNKTVNVDYIPKVFGYDLNYKYNYTYELNPLSGIMNGFNYGLLWFINVPIAIAKSLYNNKNYHIMDEDCIIEKKPKPIEIDIEINDDDD